MNTTSGSLTTSKIAPIAVFIALLGIAVVAPLAGNQLITGTIVNATLFVAVAMLGMRNGLLVGIIPSTVALATGLLPPVLAPMVPFIIVGNAILAIAFGYLINKNYWLGAIAGAVLKFTFLWAISSTVTNLLLNQQLASNVAMMMSWPQLVTAILGGLIAYGFLHVIRHPVK